MSYNIELQEQTLQNFDQMLMDWREGLVDFDAIEEELENMRDDEDVEARTWEKCCAMWTEAQAEDDEWQELLLEKDQAYRDLQSGE